MFCYISVLVIRMKLQFYFIFLISLFYTSVSCLTGELRVNDCTMWPTPRGWEGSLRTDVLEISPQCEAWAVKSPVFIFYVTFHKFLIGFFDLNYFSPHRGVHKNSKWPHTPKPSGKKEKQESEKVLHISQPPVCNSHDCTLQEGLPRRTSFVKSEGVIQKNGLFSLDSPDLKDIKALIASGVPENTDRPPQRGMSLNLSPWPMFRTSPGSRSLCRNCPWALCCWSSPSSGRTCWRAARMGWGYHWPASPCCPGRASTLTPLRRWSPSSRRTPRMPPPPLCSRPVSCFQTSPVLWGYMINKMLSHS